MDGKIQGIYCIRCLPSTKLYIGSSINISNRVTQHKSTLKAGRHHNPQLQSDWLKYGGNNFTFSILEITESLTERENYWIDYYGFDNCYNVSTCTYAPTRSPEVVAKGLATKKAKGSYGTLTEAQVLIVIEMLNDNYSDSEIANTFNMSREAINAIRNKNTWKYLSSDKYIKQNTKHIVSKAQHKKVIELLQQGIKQKDIATIVGVSESYISNHKPKTDKKRVLSEEEILDIHYLSHITGIRQKDIARYYKVHPSVVSRIKAGNRKILKNKGLTTPAPLLINL